MVRNFMIDSVEVNLQRGLVGLSTADPVLEAVTNRIVQITRQHQRAMRQVTARYGISLGDAEVLCSPKAITVLMPVGLSRIGSVARSAG
jgi:hypothetical protein